MNEILCSFCVTKFGVYFRVTFVAKKGEVWPISLDTHATVSVTINDFRNTEEAV